MGWIMLQAGYIALVLFTALVVVAWVDFATETDLTAMMALAITAAIVLLGGIVQYFLFAKIRSIHGRP